MRRTGGVFLILAGLAVSAHVLTGSTAGSAGQGETAQSQSGTAEVSAPPSIAEPASARTAGDFRPASVPTDRTLTPPPVGATRQKIPKVHRALRKSAHRMVVVTGASRTPVGQPAALASPPLSRTALTRELQQQLRRVGCYGGSVSGVWTPSTRRAMKEFTSRMNASLPVDQPDEILLAMLQTEKDKVCGPACPPGDSLAGDGRCVSGTIAAQDAKRAPGTPVPGRMGLAGPNGEDGDAAAVARDRTRHTMPHPKQSRSRYRRDDRPFGWRFPKTPFN